MLLSDGDVLIRLLREGSEMPVVVGWGGGGGRLLLCMPAAHQPPPPPRTVASVIRVKLKEL